MKFFKWLHKNNLNKLIFVILLYLVLGFVLNKTFGRYYFENHIGWIYLTGAMFWLPFGIWVDKKIENETNKN